MDLAKMIIETATDSLKTQCLQNKCDIEITLHNRYIYNITITPMLSFILIKHKTLEYKIQKNDKESYIDIIEFLIKAIDISCDNMIKIEEIYEPDELWELCCIKVNRHNKQVFYVEFTPENFTTYAMTYMKTLRYLN